MLAKKKIIAKFESNSNYSRYKDTVFNSTYLYKLRKNIFLTILTY